jgi:hypothetical protein
MPTYIYLNDSGSNTWQLGVFDDGTLDPVPVAPQSPALLYLDDVDTGTTTWLLGITLLGAPDVTPETFNPTQPNFITLESSGGYFWNLKIYADGTLFTSLAPVPSVPGFPCGIPGNVTVQGPEQLLTIIPIDVSATGSPVLLATPIYQYANLDLPFSPNDPGLLYTYQNTDKLLHKTLAARFFNLLDEYSDPLFLDVGLPPVPPTTGASGGLLPECIDVRSFGALGNGIADDTAAVQAALNQAYQNYLAQVAAGLVNTNATLGITGNLINTAISGAGGTFGPTIVCIPSGVICKVYPRTFENPVFLPADNQIGMYALSINDGVTLQVDGGLILGYDLSVLREKASLNCSMGSSSGFNVSTAWILENANAFAGGSYGPSGGVLSPQPSLVQAIASWELGPRNTNIRVTGQGFFDCGAGLNSTIAQSGGWDNEMRGGAIRFLKCDQSQIDAITVQNFNSAQGIYWGHSQNISILNTRVQHSYGGSVFAQNGVDCTPPFFVALQPEISVADFLPYFTGGGWSTGSFSTYGGFTADPHPYVLMFLCASHWIGGSGHPGVPQAPVSLVDNQGHTAELVGGPVNFFPFGPTHEQDRFWIYSLVLPDGIPEGYELTLTANYAGPGTGYAGGGIFEFVFARNCASIDQIDTNIGTSTGTASITTSVAEPVVTFTTMDDLDIYTPFPSGVGAPVFNNLNTPGYKGGSYGNLASPNTYTPVWTGTGYTASWAGVFSFTAMSAQTAGSNPTQSAMEADYKFFGIALDVLRNATVAENQFLDVNSAIGEFACSNININNNQASQGGMPPYGLHYATDISMLYHWTFQGELNSSGKRYGNLYSNNRGQIWDPNMWIPASVNRRTVTPTNYQAGNDIWVALAKGQSLTPGVQLGGLNYPYYTGVTGPTEPDWSSPDGTLSADFSFGAYGAGPWPYVLDAVVPVTNTLVGFWCQRSNGGASGDYFSLPASDPNWDNNFANQNFASGSSSVTAFRNGAALTQGVDWFPGLNGQYLSDFIQFAASFVAADDDVITVNMNTQIMWVDVGPAYTSYPAVPPTFFINGGYGNVQTMLGYRTWDNQILNNYMDGVGFEGLDHGLISRWQILNNTGSGIIDLGTTACAFLASVGMTIAQNYANGDTGPELNFTPGTAWTVDNPEVDPVTIIRGGATQSFYNQSTNEVPSGTINGTNTVFTLANTPVPSTLVVYKNGLRTMAYTLVGSVITFTTAPTTSVICDYSY